MSPDRWLDARRPTPPDALRGHFPGGVGAPASLADELGGRALEALRRSLRTPGRVRESAFDLLAADALLTYACEAALESPDPEGVLGAILRRIVVEGE